MTKNSPGQVHLHLSFWCRLVVPSTSSDIGSTTRFWLGMMWSNGLKSSASEELKLCICRTKILNTKSLLCITIMFLLLCAIHCFSCCWCFWLLSLLWLTKLTRGSFGYESHTTTDFHSSITIQLVQSVA